MPLASLFDEAQFPAPPKSKRILSMQINIGAMSPWKYYPLTLGII